MGTEAELASLLEHVNPQEGEAGGRLPLLQSRLHSLLDDLSPAEGAAALARLLILASEHLSDEEAFHLAMDYTHGRGFAKAEAEGRILEAFTSSMDHLERLSAAAKAHTRRSEIAREQAELHSRQEALRAREEALTRKEWDASLSPEESAERERLRQEGRRTAQLLVELSVEGATLLPPLPTDEVRRILQSRRKRRAAVEQKRAEETFERMYAQWAVTAAAPPPPAPGAEPLPGAGEEPLVGAGPRWEGPRYAPAGPLGGGTNMLREELEEIRRKLEAIDQSRPAPVMAATQDQIEMLVRQALSELGPAEKVKSQSVLPSKKKGPRGDIIEI